MFQIYVLSLIENKFYVGKSQNVPGRITQHIDGSGSVWTKIYKPVEIVEVLDENSPYDEDSKTLEYMQNYGIANVRGGSFCEVNLAESQIDVIQKMIKSANNVCFKCGGSDHLQKNCHIGTGMIKRCTIFKPMKSAVSPPDLPLAIISDPQMRDIPGDNTTVGSMLPFSNILVGKNDTECAQLFLESRNNLTKAVGKIWIKNNNVWSDDPDLIKCAILLADIRKYDAKGEPVSYSSNMKGCDAIHRTLRAVLPDDTNFISDLNKKNLNRVHYRNGYFNLTESTFVPDCNDMCLLRVERDFDQEFHNTLSNDSILVKELEGKLLSCFATIEEKKMFFKALARAIGGNYKDKRWYICTGDRNSGKGTMFGCVHKTFDSYVVALPQFSAKSHQGEVAKSNSWILSSKCHLARIGYTNEATTISGKPTVLDGNMIKTICSGGDPIVTRLNYQDEVTIVNNSTIFMAFNQVPISEPADAIKTAIVLPFPFVYDDREPRFAYERRAWDIKTWIEECPRFCEIFEWYVYQHWDKIKVPLDDIPAVCNEYKEALLENTAVDGTDILTRYFTHGEYCEASIVNDYFKEHLKMSPQKVKIFLEKAGYKKDRRRIGDNPNPQHVYLGIQIKQIDYI